VSEEAFCDAALATLERYATIPSLSRTSTMPAGHGHLEAAMTLFADWRGPRLGGAEVTIRRIEAARRCS